MKRFVFRLERVLQLREAHERERARELGQALQEETRRRDEARASQERLQQARSQFSETPRELSQAGTLRNLELAIEQLAGQTRAAEAAHEQSLQRVEAERERFDQARRERRVIERLREQRRDAWGAELTRYEQGLNDETAAQRARQRDREGV